MKRKNGDGTCYYLKNKNLYAYQVQINGSRKTFYGKTEREAFTKMLQYNNNDTKTFREWCIYWIDTYKTSDYKMLTLEKESSRLNKILNIAGFSDKKLSDIKPSDIQLFVNEQNKAVSPKTIKNYMLLINGAFKQAIKENIIDINPCESISIPKLIKPDMVALSRADKDLFIALNQDNEYIDFFIFALNTGMRISEICGLQKNNVDLDNNIIYVKEQLVKLKGKVILDTPKTENSIRAVPMNEKTKEIIKKYINRSKDGFVFHNPKTNNILMQDTLSTNCRRCLKKCYEITKKEVYSKANFHTFRHTFATQWILQGGNVNLLSKVLGHTDTSFTMRVYCQPDYSDIKQAMLNMSF